MNFEDEAIREIARMAAQLNKTVENIGARRLHTVMERIMENISFDAAELDSGSVGSRFTFSTSMSRTFFRPLTKC